MYNFIGNVLVFFQMLCYYKPPEAKSIFILLISEVINKKELNMYRKTRAQVSATPTKFRAQGANMFSQED